jgi:transcriptional regulator with XRE-family HTH domain
MPHLMYLLDGARVRQLREASGLSQREFADRADIGLRTLSAVEGNARTVKADIATQIAEVLEKSLGELGEPVVSWLWVPNLDPPDQRKLTAAIRGDMRGEHAKAAERCRDVLLAAEELGEFEVYAAVLVKLVTFLDHAGEHEQALDELDSFFVRVDTEHPTCHGEIDWARYHRGICLRRLERFDDARLDLQQLVDDGGPYRQSALYQLVVVDLEQALKDGARRLPVDLLDRLQECHDAWIPQESHRHAFPLRRMGQWYAVNGQYRESCECFMKAIELFARHDCDRYVEASFKDMRKYVLDRICPV